VSLRYLIDTDWAIHYMNGEAQTVERLAEFQPDGIGISVVSLAELWDGIWYSRDREGSEIGLREFLRTVTLLPLDEEAGRRFGRERGRLRALHQLIGDVDLLIGATALSHDLILLTNNRRHFEMIEGLRLVSW
jgi:tRNA(fMet)-specific endonuclease VapC